MNQLQPWGFLRKCCFDLVFEVQKSLTLSGEDKYPTTPASNVRETNSRCANSDCSVESIQGPIFGGSLDTIKNGPDS